jgi:hypothetical protein
VRIINAAAIEARIRPIEAPNGSRPGGFADVAEELQR